MHCRILQTICCFSASSGFVSMKSPFLFALAFATSVSLLAQAPPAAKPGTPAAAPTAAPAKGATPAAAPAKGATPAPAAATPPAAATSGAPLNAEQEMEALFADAQS